MTTEEDIKRDTYTAEHARELRAQAERLGMSPSAPDREQAVEKVALLIFADVQAAVTEPTAKRLAEAIVAALFGERGDES